jgi:hypothetical protein
MRKILSRLWQDDAGFVVSTELVLVATILVVGVTIGQATLRDAVISELADTADMVNNINQSYSYTSVTGHSSSVAGSALNDVEDFCEAGTDGAQTGVGSGTCIDFAQAADNEGT